MTHPQVEVGYSSLGLMGSPLAGLLRAKANCRVLVPNLRDRSKESQDRAEKEGLEGVQDLQCLFEDGKPLISYFVSVLPPSEALGLAKQVADLTSDQGSVRPIFVDCNAISPASSLQISQVITGKGWRYVCGSIIGGPPRGDGFRPAIYLSGEEASVKEFQELAERATWKVIILKDSGVGASKALKLSFSMIAKGMMELTATSMLAASSYSPSTSSALVTQIGASLPGILPFLSGQLENVTPKSGRFVGEFDEIGSYVDSRLASADKVGATASSAIDGCSSDFRPGDMFRSMAKMWRWFSRSEGKEERHAVLMEAQNFLKKELSKAKP